MAKSRRQVFISAAESDAVWAQDLSKRLQAAGVDARTPMTETFPGANVLAELGRALNRADAIVVLVSPAAMKSPWVRHEIQFALGQEKFQNRLIPVLVKRTPPDEIPWILQKLQWAKGPADKVAEQIVTTLDVPRRREARAKAS